MQSYYSTGISVCIFLTTINIDIWRPFCLTCLQGVIKRDQMVFEEVRRRGIPILMVTSGGYQVSVKHCCIYSGTSE